MLPFFLAATMIASTQTGRPPECNIRNIDACEHVHHILWERDFEQALARFFGSVKGRLIRIDSPLLYKQLFDAFTSVNISHRPLKLPDGNRFLEGCLAHFCTQQAAVVMTPKGEILAVALYSHQSSRGLGVDPPNIGLMRDLDIFIARRGIHNRPWLRAIANWAADSKVKDTGLRRLRVHVLSDLQGKRLPP